MLMLTLNLSALPLQKIQASVGKVWAQLGASLVLALLSCLRRGGEPWKLVEIQSKTPQELELLTGSDQRYHLWVLVIFHVRTFASTEVPELLSPFSLLFLWLVATSKFRCLASVKPSKYR